MAKRQALKHTFRADWLFGEPTLMAVNSSLASWSKEHYQKSGTGWTANLYGGVMSGDDFAAVFIPTNELPVKDFTDALWTYYMTNDEAYGVNIVIWVHDPDDNDKRAEITQLGSVSGLAKAQYWNAHELDITTDQFFFYGENTTGTTKSNGATNLYGWDDFQADPLFSGWTIYRISIEYGWIASGTLEDVWVADIKLNGQVIALKPPTGSPISFHRVTTSEVTTLENSTKEVLGANAARKYALIVNDSNVIVYIALGQDAVQHEGIRLNANGSAYEITPNNLFTGAINCICANSGKILLVTEGK